MSTHTEASFLSRLLRRGQRAKPARDCRCGGTWPGHPHHSPAAREQARIITVLSAAADDAASKWRNGPAAPHPSTEYERGYMNAMNQAIGIVNDKTVTSYE